VAEIEAERLGPGPKVADVEDLTVPASDGSDSASVPVRVYRPSDHAPLPVVVYFHGGGWVIGDVATHDAFARTMAVMSGCMIVSVDYRLAPEHKYPAALDDCRVVTQWALRHADQIGGNPARVALLGDSAGGNLAAAVCLAARDRGQPLPRFQALVYPVTDYRFDTPSYRENADGYLLSRDAMRWFWDQYLPDPAQGAEPYASPLRAENLSGLPPALVITAGYDPLRDEGEAYARRLAEAGVPVELARYPGMIHAFIRMDALIDEAARAQRQIADALRRVLEPPTAS
jgi:acetyl esterase